MQRKVSMVIPCYNKVEYIDDMFQSVYDQTWNRIELILVNDGSNDGTREKIAEWEPKFINCGYEVVIIDQANKGVGTSVKNGLIRITGDYFCLPDCDDILSPRYVAAMAEVLDRDSSVEWVWCNIAPSSPLLQVKNKNKLLLLYLLHKWCVWAVWPRMVRTSYLEKCRVLDIYLESRITQEPQVGIPLAAGGSWPHIICENLYKYNTSVELSIRNASQKNSEEVISFWRDYQKLQLGTLEALGLLNEEHKLAIEIALLSNIQIDIDFTVSRHQKLLLRQLNLAQNADDKTMEMLQDFTSNIVFNVAEEEPYYMTQSLENASRIICCCCLGKIGRTYLPRLKEVGLNPDILWDASADLNRIEYHGINVTKPDYTELKKGDVVLILSIVKPNIYEIEKAIGNNAKVFDMDDIRKYIGWRCTDIFKIEG